MNVRLLLFIIFVGIFFNFISYSMGNTKSISCEIIEIQQKDIQKGIDGYIKLECSDISNKLKVNTKVALKIKKKKQIEGC